MAKMDNEQFEKFLEIVDLGNYRKKFMPIKIVEMDLPREIQALDLLYKIYWDKRKVISYEQFYEEYRKLYRKNLELFRNKTQMCKTCFYKGLPARIYRTWASIITQIHAGYVAEAVFGEKSVEMSSELDHQGADFRVTYKGKKLNYQVKKETFSREVRAEKKPKKQLYGKFIKIVYKVPNFDMLLDPNKKKGGFKKAYSEFKADWLDTGKIKILKNGFTVFTPTIFEEEKALYD
ncbi:MAG: TaqI family restriction endonuclease [Candidatus Omnitrophota bacterium]|jgi:hypothetical protein|nr:MAG: TaqI family restriction endonuclease [Candidatus Omnitrophota bacterium]